MLEYIKTFQYTSIPIILICGVFWGGDKCISKKGASRLYASIKSAVVDTEKSNIYIYLREFLDKNYSLKIGYIKVFRNVLVFTILSMLLMLSIYAKKQPMILDVIFTSGFLKQFIGSGLLIVLLTNFATVALYPFTSKGLLSESLWKSTFYLASEAIFKVFVFLVVTFLTWSYFAYIEDAFGGGGAESAFAAIPATLKLALTFDNLTSVYLYSLALSSFPFFIVSVIRLMSRYPVLGRAAEKTLFWLPLEDKPIRIASIVAGVSTLIFFSSAAVVASF